MEELDIKSPLPRRTQCIGGPLDTNFVMTPPALKLIVDGVWPATYTLTLRDDEWVFVYDEEDK